MLDLKLALGVEGTGSLIEEEDARLANEGASDSNPLLLATRQSCTSFTDNSLETMREQDLVIKEPATGLLASKFDALINLGVS